MRNPFHARALRDDRGVALAMVIGMAAVLLLLVSTALTFSVSAMTKAKTDDNANAALAAAYAGVSDYQSRLTNDNTYQRYGDKTAPFSVSTGSTALSPDTTNLAFDWGVGGRWATIAGATGNTAYRYEVDNSQYANKGVIRIRSTGRSGTVTKSIIANVRQKGFLDYLYFTDYETQDPAITGKLVSKCEIYYPDRDDDDCGGAIQFGAGEVINGPLHSNDALYICAGSTFNGSVTSAYNTAPFYRNCGAANFTQGKPAHDDSLEMPPTNTELRYETRSDLTATDVPRPGCLYTGPTKVTFNGDGTMTVRSPWTKAVNITATGGATNTACGTPGLGTNNGTTLGSSAGQTIPVPVQNVVYVQEVPSDTADPNGWAATSTPAGFSCPENGNGLGFPMDTTTTSGRTTIETKETNLSSKAGPYYGCRAGDVFVKGSVDKAVKGQVTIAAANYVWVTGNLKYADPGVDVLGLIGQNAVWVWNPYGTVKTSGSGSNSTTTDSLLTDTGREIDAAIMSVKHTFQVQNFEDGSPRGQLTVLGAIAQKFRGTVGRPPIGYSKNYSYDVRFRSIAPPKFLQAVSTTYGISQVAEVKAAFDAKGNVR